MSGVIIFQMIQRQLQQVEEKQRQLEERGVTLEKALRGEAGHYTHRVHITDHFCICLSAVSCTCFSFILGMKTSRMYVFFLKKTGGEVDEHDHFIAYFLFEHVKK